VRSRAGLVAKFSRLELRRPLNEEFRHSLTSLRQPINGLPVRDSWAYRICEILTLSRKWLRVHYNKEHSMRGNVPREPDIKIQTLFTVLSSAVHYFCVSHPNTDTEEGGNANSAHARR
jgi:hypothetical protein